MNNMVYSGVEWIGDIPENWKLCRFKDCYKSVKEIVGKDSINYERLALTLNGVIKRNKDDSDGLQPQAFDTYQLLRKNDFVFKMIDLQNISTSRVGLSDFDGLVSPAYLRFSPLSNQQNTKYDYYFLMSMYYNCVFNNLGGNGVRSALNAKDMGGFVITNPDDITKSKIVEYLDKKNEQIQKLILNQEEQIKNLKEYKHSLISEIVIKGLNENVETRESEIEWLGRIPKHWKINRGKNVLNLLNRKIKDTDEVITCFRDGEVTLRKNRREDGFTFSNKEIGYQGIEVGDLVIHGMDGFAGAIGISDSRGKASPVLIVCDSSHNKKYLCYYLRNLAYRDIFQALSTGIRVRSCDLRWNKLSVLPIVLPPKEEQEEIVNYLDRKCEQIENLIKIKESKIENLIAYKKSIVFEYVTGKKKI